MLEYVASEGHTRIYWYYVKGVPAQISLFYAVGGLYQSKGKEGIAHLLEHIITQPSSEQDRDYQNEHHVYVGAWTDSNYVTVAGRSMDPLNFNKLLKLMAKKIYDTPVDQESFEREVAAIKHELSDYDSDYPNTNQVVMHDYLSMGSSFNQRTGLVEGEAATQAERITPEDLKDYRSYHFTAPVVIVVVGGVRPAAIELSRVKELFLSPVSKLPEPIRLRKSLPSKGTTILDTLRQSGTDKTYVGLGWVSQFEGKHDFVNWLMFANTLADSSRGLYDLLRNREQIIYDLHEDIEVVGGKYQLFSLHTLTETASKRRVKKLVIQYLSDESLVKKDIKARLSYEQAALHSLYDGSESILSWQARLVPVDMSLGEFKKYVTNATADTIYESCKDKFSSQMVNVVYS